MNALIIGAGIIGLSIARELHRRGVGRITLLEKGSVGKEASWAAAGMLAPNAEATEADRLFQLGTDSINLYPQFVAELQEETCIDSELDRSGTLQLAFDEDEMGSLVAKHDVQRSMGSFSIVTDRDDILQEEPAISTNVLGGLFYPADHQVDNRKLLAALREYCRLQSIEIVENCPVDTVGITEDVAWGANAYGRQFQADITILATGAWSSLIEPRDRLGLNVRPIRGQMIVYHPSKPLLTKVVYGPDCYLVPRADGRLLVGATVEDAGFDRSVTNTAVAALRNAARAILPALAELEIVDAWAGLRPAAPDLLPIIGTIAGIERLIVATAHYRNGILLAPITAKLIADKVVENIESEYISAFAPDRFAANASAAVNQT
jgi:glycine oxidase